MLLTDLKVGEKGKIISVSHNFSLYNRLVDIGFSKDTLIECVLKSPLKDPTAYLIKGTIIALRKEDAKHITVRGV